MSKRILTCCLVLMFMAFAGSIWAGTEGASNNFYGTGAGSSMSGGVDETFMGAYAGYKTTTGSDNTFLGYEAGYNNTDGYYNNFSGFEAGFSNTIGYYNNFFGYQAGYSNTTGNSNNFIGFDAGFYNTTGYDNNFSGFQAGLSNTIERNNTLIGYSADIDGTTPGTVTNSTAIGNKAYVSQANSLVLGSIAGVNYATSSVNVGIGTSAPVRQLHLVGSNAVFRMDRTADTAAFMLVRTDGSGNPQKTFVVGANSSGSGVGTFVIKDLGTAV